MAQPKVTEFFNVCKKNPIFQPKKLRDVVGIGEHSFEEKASFTNLRNFGKRDFLNAEKPKSRNINRPISKKGSANLKKCQDIRKSFNSLTNHKSSAESDSPINQCDKTPTSKFPIVEERSKVKFRSLRKSAGLDFEVTPTKVEFQPLASSAKKRLILDYDDESSATCLKRAKYESDKLVVPKDAQELPKRNSVILTPEVIKAKLGKCGKLKELQERLAKVNDCASQIRNLQQKHPRSPVKLTREATLRFV